MKKSLLYILSLATVFGMASCQKNEYAPSTEKEGTSFDLTAEIQQTRTTYDNLKVDWEESDVLYLVTTDKIWGKPYPEDKNSETIAEFKYADGKFTSDATITDGKHTFSNC